MRLQDIPNPTRDARLKGFGPVYAAYPKTPCTRCDACSSDDSLITVTDRDRYGFQAPTLFCRACGLFQLAERLTPAAQGQFYREMYRPLLTALGGVQHDLAQIQASQGKYALQLLRWLAPHLPMAATHILDVGGSTGLVAGAFQAAYGGDVLVLDPAPEETAVAHAAGHATLTMRLEDAVLTLHPAHYDLILCCQTLDHVADIGLALATLKDALAPGGYLMVDVVDVLAIMRRHQNVRVAFKVDHTYGWTEPVIRWKLEMAGFDIVAAAVAPDRMHLRFLCRGDVGAIPRHPVIAIAQIWETVRTIQAQETK